MFWVFVGVEYLLLESCKVFFRCPQLSMFRTKESPILPLEQYEEIAVNPVYFSNSFWRKLMSSKQLE